MKTKLLLSFLISMFFSINMYATNCSSPSDSSIVEETAAKPYTGDIESYTNYVLLHLQEVPQVISELESGVSGFLFLEFNVDTTGLLNDLKVINSVSPLIDNEIIKIMRNGPKWIPAKRGDKTIVSKNVFQLSLFLTEEE